MFEQHKVFGVEQTRHELIVVPYGDAAGFRDMDVENELNAVLDEIERSDQQPLLIDFENSDYFGTVIIGAAVRLAQAVAAKGCRTAVCNLSEQMQQVLQVMKIETLLPSFPSRRKAQKSLR